ncbi:MAG TPA: hypothetical protein VEV85_27770 [Bryobacteraceae bacterium]|nr:hypothetical protein [Bryobacteraceae bacterium]
MASSLLHAALSVKPPSATICPGETITFSTGNKNTTWSISPTPSSGISLDANTGKLQVDSEVEAQQAFIVTGSASGDSGEAALVVTKDGCSDNEARAVIGFEQAGASATQAEQKFFFDFLIDRELKWKSVSLWGNVRVSSYPQQISTPLAQFDIASAVGQLPVNKLAETASFLTGFDIHLKRLTFPVRAGTRRLGFIGSFGATGPFTPEGRVALFAVPNSSSQQYSPFTAQFPQAKGSTYVGFVPPDRNQFYRQWSTGVRVTTMYREHLGFTSPSATYTATIGQDEAVTAGRLHGAVLKFDVFYPMPVKFTAYRFLYLFGTAALQVKRAHNETPFVLQPAPSDVHGYDSSVAIISSPSNRDTYRIGVGLDAVGVVCTIWASKCS